MQREEYEAKHSVLETFSRGLSLFYEGRFRDARDIFSSIGAEDPPATRYAEKCSLLIQNVPESWSGVWVMTEK